MKKQLLLFVLMLLPLVANADSVLIDGVYYNLNAEAKTAEVASNPDKYSGCVIIPSSVKFEGTDYAVTSIGKNAFYMCPNLSCVVIGKNVTAISGNNTFARGKLKDVWSLMETPPVIASKTFQLNIKATLHVPAGSLEAFRNADVWNTSFLDIVAIDDNPINDNPIAFADANVKALCVANWDKNGDGELSEIEAFVVTDLNGVFSQNETITSFDELPYFVNVSSIGENEFKDCSHLTSICIPSCVSSIGSEAFSGCSSLVDVWAYMQTPPYIEKNTFTNRSNATLHIRANNMNAYRNADYWNEFLNILAISDKPISNNPIVFTDANVKALCVANWDTNGDGELSEMEASKVMDLNGVFSQNEAITSFDELSYFISLQRIGDNEFKGCSNLASISIPCCVASIGTMDTYTNEAFSGCNHLLKVELHCDAIVAHDFPEWGSGLPVIFGRQVEEYILGDEISGIGRSAFQGAQPMKSIKISNNVTRIGRRAFEWCYGNLRSVTLPNSLRVIEDYAFHGCDMLTSITIPANVESIGDFAFEQCGSLGRVFCLAKQIPETNYMPFSGSNYPKATLLVPANLINNYRKSEQWNVFGNIVALESAVDGLYYKFDDNAKTAEIVSITEGFGGAVAVPSTVNYSEGQYHVTGIGASAFIGCYDLTSVTIPNSVTSIGESAFQNCTGLTSVVLGEGVASIGASAFYGCTSLPSVVIPSSVENIGVSVFQYCPALTSIKVDNGNAIYDSRENCNAVIATAINTLLLGCQNTVIPEDVTKIGDYAFSSCFGLTSIHIPDGVTEIGPYAFYGCTGLTSITIPSSVATLGYWSLAYCTGLTAVDITNLDAWCSFDFYDLYGNYSNPLYIAKHLYLNGKEVKDLVIPEGVPSIGHCAFQGLTDLASVVIPSSVTKIGIDAFSGCLNMTNVYCYAEQVPVDKEQEGDDYVYSYMWNGFDCQNATLHVPAGSIEDYRNDPKWKNFGNIVALTEEDPKPTAIMNVNNDVMTSQQYYSLDGKRIVKLQRGLNIVKMKDGTTRKVLVK